MTSGDCFKPQMNTDNTDQNKTKSGPDRVYDQRDRNRVATAPVLIRRCAYSLLAGLTVARGDYRFKLVFSERHYRKLRLANQW